VYIAVKIPKHVVVKILCYIKSLKQQNIPKNYKASKATRPQSKKKLIKYLGGGGKCGQHILVLSIRK